MEVQNLDKLQAKLKAREMAARKDDGVACAVGYTAAYALYVHENLEARHKAGKQAKFLEQPARALGKELGRIIAELKRQGKTLAQCLLVAGLRLQRESQLLVPVDTGNLKGSAFTRLEDR